MYYLLTFLSAASTFISRVIAAGENARQTRGERKVPVAPTGTLAPGSWLLRCR